MEQFKRTRHLCRCLAWMLVILAWTILAGPLLAQDGRGANQDESFWSQVMQILAKLFNMSDLLDFLKDRLEFQLAAFVVLNVIVFVETGLLIGFFLPGDSLLVTAGVVWCATGWNLPLLLVTLCISAIVGDSVGYSIGFKAGPKIFNREKSLLFNRDHLLVAQAFYEKHGGKTIILARFMPIIRTFAPVVAGVGQMQYRRFLFFNIFGGISWVASMVLIGYVLTDAVDPIFQDYILHDKKFTVRNHIEKVIIIVVFLSISPGIFMWLKSKLKGKQPAPPELAGKIGE